METSELPCSILPWQPCSPPWAPLWPLSLPLQGALQLYLNLHTTLPLLKSVHAHIILWLHPEDVESAASKIVCAMPCDGWDPEAGPNGTGDWIPPADPPQLRLHHVVRR